MDHEVAGKTQAVERYLLGEMPSSERDEFEEHYFTCAECADEIRSASLLIGARPAANRELPPATGLSSPGWLSWLRPPVLVPTFAALALAVVVGYQNLVVLPDLKAPRSIASALILDGRTRGGLPVLRAGDPLRFMTAVEGSAGSRLYVELAGASGSPVRRGEVPAPPPNGALDVFFPGTLAVGRYQLIVRETAAGRELARGAFEVVN